MRGERKKERRLVERNNNEGRGSDLYRGKGVEPQRLGKRGVLRGGAVRFRNGVEPALRGVRATAYHAARAGLAEAVRGLFGGEGVALREGAF